MGGRIAVFVIRRFPVQAGLETVLFGVDPGGLSQVADHFIDTVLTFNTASCRGCGQPTDKQIKFGPSPI